jgi:hypothetical protein
MRGRKKARKRDRTRTNKEDIAVLVGEAEAREEDLLKLEEPRREDCREIFQERPGTRVLVSGPIVDRAAAKEAEIVKLEELQRETRRKFIQAGRPDLNRRFLSAPLVLRQLAGCLWRNEPLVGFLTRSQALKPGTWRTQEESISALNYPKQFTLTRRSCENWCEVKEDWYREFSRHLLQMWAVKKEADVTRRIKTAGKRRQNVTDKKSIYRQMAIELAPMFSLEEWACIFPDAVVAGDTDFIQEITASLRPVICKGKWQLPFSKEYLALAIYWHGFRAVGLENKVPPLKHWSDKAACEFVKFATGNDKLELSNYQMHKSRFELHSEKPLLVSYADYASDGTTERLTCSR